MARHLRFLFAILFTPTHLTLGHVEQNLERLAQPRRALLLCHVRHCCRPILTCAVLCSSTTPPQGLGRHVGSPACVSRFPELAGGPQPLEHRRNCRNPAVLPVAANPRSCRRCSVIGGRRQGQSACRTHAPDSPTRRHVQKGHWMADGGGHGRECSRQGIGGENLRLTVTRGDSRGKTRKGGADSAGGPVGRADHAIAEPYCSGHGAGLNVDSTEKFGRRGKSHISGGGRVFQAMGQSCR